MKFPRNVAVYKQKFIVKKDGKEVTYENMVSDPITPAIALNDRGLHSHQCPKCGEFYHHAHGYKKLDHKIFDGDCPHCEADRSTKNKGMPGAQATEMRRVTWSKHDGNKDTKSALSGVTKHSVASAGKSVLKGASGKEAAIEVIKRLGGRMVNPITHLMQAKNADEWYDDAGEKKKRSVKLSEARDDTKFKWLRGELALRAAKWEQPEEDFTYKVGTINHWIIELGSEIDTLNSGVKKEISIPPLSLVPIWERAEVAQLFYELLDVLSRLVSPVQARRVVKQCEAARQNLFACGHVSCFQFD